MIISAAIYIYTNVATDEDLELIFSRFGTILSCEVIRDKRTGDSLQYAFIEFEHQKDCEQAYFKMQSVLIDDHRIHVDFSQSVSAFVVSQKARLISKTRSPNYQILGGQLQTKGELLREVLVAFQASKKEDNTELRKTARGRIDTGWFLTRATYTNQGKFPDEEAGAGAGAGVLSGTNLQITKSTAGGLIEVKTGVETMIAAGTTEEERHMIDIRRGALKEPYNQFFRYPCSNL